MEHTALLLIDIQKGLNDICWGKRNNPKAEENMTIILTSFRNKNLPIYHVQHLSTSPNSPLQPNQPGVEFMDFAIPLADEIVFQKNVNSAFIGTTLHETLIKNKITTLFLIGITTDHCVSTTARMAANLGFKTNVVADATFTFERKGFDGKYFSAEEMHNISLASLHEEFATVLDTRQLINLLSNNK
jgi:nicotinamidase-related amidase